MGLTMKKINFFIAICIGLFLFICAGNVQATTTEEEVRNLVQQSIDQILTILKDPAYAGDDNKEKRREMLRTAINTRFSFVKMSQLSLARTWKKLSAEQKKEFVGLFGQLLEDTYISKIESYTNEKIVYGKTFVQKNKAKVNTKIITDTVEIPINYSLVRTKKGDWVVYDMVIEGVSLVGNYRNQFKGVSYDELVAKLKDKQE